MAGNEDTSYVPKSPDFSSFLAQSPPQPHSFPPSAPPPPRDNHAQQTAHHLHQPPPGSYHFPASSAAYTHAPAPAPAPHLNHAHSPQFQPQSAPSSFSAPAQFHPALDTRDGGASDFGNTFQQHHHQPHLQPNLYQYQHSQPRSQPPQPYPPQEAYTGQPHHPAHPQQHHFSQPYANPPQPNSYLPNSYPYPAGLGGTTAIPLAEPQHIDQTGKMPPRRAAQQAPPPPLIDPSPVRTKFPTARIKRIMQADEEVGKVAQQTPIAVGKALELFMISMVTKSADVAKGKGQKRITANMLKQVVEKDDQFDFLREIVGKVEATDDKKNSRVKSETESEEEVIPEPKRRVRAARKKKET